jgi:5'-deoxynucleotidase YfbR-like HD superfamily hydrolase
MSRATWIQTFTGLAFDLADPKPEQVAIEDIAHALAMIPRYTGHCRYHYSVAQHSVMVASIVAATDPALTLAALLHDAAEAYLNDWSSPLKFMMRLAHRTGDAATEERLQVALELEEQVERVIGERFGVDLSRNATIKAADLVALATEKRDLFGPSPRPGWGDATGYAMPEPLSRPVARLSIEAAESIFLSVFRGAGGKS